MNEASDIAILIPCLNPDKRMVELVVSLRRLCDYPIIIVNDGSREANLLFFDEAAKIPGVFLTHHCVNLGKGRALKTGFNEFLLRFPSGIGLCTADGDGQHLPEDIIKCCDALRHNQDSLILGVRNFSDPGVPWKSRFGNTLTSAVFGLMGLRISDTQTGLRGMGTELMKKLMNSFGERFEFETVMLLDSAHFGVPFCEVPIKTVYLDGNSETHFNPLKDSIRIYNVILKRWLSQILKFVISGLLSFGVDIGLFALLFYKIVPALGAPRLITSVVLARGCSLGVNYLLNYNMVFCRGQKSWASMRSFVYYLLLCMFIMMLSYSLTRLFISMLSADNAVICKTMADVICFFVSFSVQKKFIFAYDKIR